MLFRLVLSLVIVATGLLFSLEAAFAGDYIVSYAFDGTTRADVAAGATSGLNEVGSTKECQYDRRCRIELTKSDLAISLYVERRGAHEVMVFADGGRSLSDNCCYFWGGDRLVTRKLAEPLLRLWIYEGQSRKRNEYVENRPLGLLYLQFSDFKLVRARARGNLPLAVCYRDLDVVAEHDRFAFTGVHNGWDERQYLAPPDTATTLAETDRQRA
ncbi:hypothetical protein [Bradyrhizobium japonicum]|uniref:hypothetical protein n=1 Tax=Bradyrhizobium japonicum TaxID=375 RepID=UPI000489C290|nr:hypothetical protein [Bradyrhizobium japonicum]